MNHFKILAATTLLCLPTFTLATTTHTRKQLAIIHSPDTRDCTFFQLVDVSEADPVTPGVPWFALPKTHLGYDEIFRCYWSHAPATNQ